MADMLLIEREQLEEIANIIRSTGDYTKENGEEKKLTFEQIKEQLQMWADFRNWYSSNNMILQIPNNITEYDPNKGSWIYQKFYEYVEEPGRDESDILPKYYTATNMGFGQEQLNTINLPHLTEMTSSFTFNRTPFVRISINLPKLKILRNSFSLMSGGTYQQNTFTIVKKLELPSLEQLSGYGCFHQFNVEELILPKIKIIDINSLMLNRSQPVQVTLGSIGNPVMPTYTNKYDHQEQSLGQNCIYYTGPSGTVTIYTTHEIADAINNNEATPQTYYTNFPFGFTPSDTVTFIFIGTAEGEVPQDDEN